MKRIIALILCAMLCWGTCALAESNEGQSGPFGAERQSVEAEIYFVRARKLNVRSGPDEFYPVIYKLKKYAKAYVIGEEGEWYKIWGSGEIGFVKKTFLRPTGRTETVELY